MGSRQVNTLHSSPWWTSPKYALLLKTFLRSPWAQGTWIAPVTLAVCCEVVANPLKYQITLHLSLTFLYLPFCLHNTKAHLAECPTCQQEGLTQPSHSLGRIRHPQTRSDLFHLGGARRGEIEQFVLTGIHVCSGNRVASSSTMVHSYWNLICLPGFS